MTCRDLLMIEHPDKLDNHLYGGCVGCPSSYYYADDPEWCSKGMGNAECRKCWDRFADPEAVKKIMDEIYKIDDIVNVNNMSVDELKDTYAAVKKSTDEPRILDSGDRTEFESGAVRDMRKGKGRCDLLPLDVVASFLATKPGELDDVLMHLYSYQTHKNERLLYTVLSAFARKRGWDDWTMLLEVAKQFEEGAAKYGDDNWRKGIPCNVYIDSAIRHYLKYLRGDKDEPHDRAFCWNILCCIWTAKHIEQKEVKEYAENNL